MKFTLFDFYLKIQNSILLLLILSGCDDNDKCLPPAVSLLSYSYTGDINGTYSVQGEVPSSTSPYQSIYDYNWAMGGLFSEYGTSWISIHSNKLSKSQYSSRVSLIVQMHVPDKGVGKYPLPNRGLDFLSLEYSLSWDDQLLFDFVSGEVNVTYHQCDRIMGTFFGELQGIHDGETVTINITDGKFDVKIIPI